MKMRTMKMARARERSERSDQRLVRNGRREIRPGRNTVGGTRSAHYARARECKRASNCDEVIQYARSNSRRG
jgi:hypothetical protein